MPQKISPFRSAALIAAALAALAGCATPRPLETVASVDLDRYLGTWYEIALIPNRFQQKCASDTRAEYVRDGEAVRVINRCRNAQGGEEEAHGIARVVEGSGNAKLRVSFFGPFYGDYQILALDSGYRWALVGEPRREYGWILARTPTLDAQTIDTLLARAEALGYERQAFRRSPQSPLPEAPVRYRCDDGHRFEISRPTPDAVVLNEPAGRRNLPATPAASGTRYSDGQVAFWRKGEEAVIERDARVAHRGCRIAAAPEEKP